MTEVVQIGDATLYHGDCLEILPTLGKVDAVVTDPPYGVGLAYESVIDTPDLVVSVAVPAIRWAMESAKTAAVTPGTRNAFSYPTPTEMGCLYFPAGAGFSRWGFTCFQPILFYGKDPHPPNNKRPNSYRSTEVSEKNGHPCPKPIRLMEWLVSRASLDGWSVLDPFMGSGTTGVACANISRKFIGIEIERKYFDIACERIDAAYRQGRLFA
jgi:site-specific DNA-methyltransferase (adenine-specific)